MNNEENEKSVENLDPLVSLHTLEGDLLASMKDEDYSSNIVKIVANPLANKTPSNPGVATEAKEKGINKKFLFIFIGAIALIGVGVGAFFVVNTGNKKGTAVNATGTSNLPLTNTTRFTQALPIFDAEVVIPIQMATKDKVGFIETVNGVKAELLANKVTSKTNITLSTDVTLDDFFNKIQYTGPQSVLRSLSADKAYNFGLFHTTGAEFESYLLVKIDSFDLAFSGMLEWEKTIPYDLQALFTYIPPVTAQPVETPAILSTSTVATTTSGTTTSTSSISEVPEAPTVVVAPYTQGTTFKFSDKVIKNIDTRIYTDSTRGVKIIYGFINKKYLLITSGESAFTDVSNKLLLTNILR